jgi:hypothetical protein
MRASGEQRFEPGPWQDRPCSGGSRIASRRLGGRGSGSGMTGVPVSDPEGLTPRSDTDYLQCIEIERVRCGRPLLGCANLGNEVLASAGPHLDAGAGVSQSGRLARHGGQTIQASGRSTHARGSGLGCGKVGLRPARPGMVERPIQASGRLRQPLRRPGGQGARSRSSGAFLRPPGSGRRSTGAARTPCSSSPHPRGQCPARL